MLLNFKPKPLVYRDYNVILMKVVVVTGGGGGIGGAIVYRYHNTVRSI